MRGKQVFMESLIAHGVEYIFGNPGTTESPILDALLDYPQLRYIVALHEGVALGAASYYAQTSGRVGVVNIHVAPGLGNALGMLYNALKARSPIVVTAGQQDTRLRLRGPVLGHDLVAMAAPLTKWSVQVERADEFALIMHRALKIATDPPAGPVFVGLPIDVLEQETDGEPLAPGRLYRAPEPDPAGVQAAAELLLGSQRPAIVVGDDAVSAAAERGRAGRAARRGRLVRGHPHVPGLAERASRTSGWACPSTRSPSARRSRVWTSSLLVGGPFFEEVWYAPGSPLPAGARPSTWSRRPSASRTICRSASGSWAIRAPPCRRCGPPSIATPARPSASPRPGATTRCARSRRRTARRSARERPSAGTARRSRCRA